MHNKKTSWILILTALLILIAIDRGTWASVAQWREDQSTNLWLGYTRSPFNIPIGVLSSVGTPNPNGMPLVGELISRLPNLWVVSTVLGVIQGGLILWIGWLVAGPRPLFFLISMPALASVVLRATSVEFWNQWVITDLNLGFFGLWLLYLRRPSPWKIALMVIPMLMAPAMYLAGLVNSILYFGFTLAGIWIRPPRGSWKDWIAPALASLALVCLSLWLTWIPYAAAVGGSSLPGMNPSFGDIIERLGRSVRSGLSFPIWNLNQWTKSTEDSFYQSSHMILNRPANLLLRLSRILLFGQAALFLAALLLAVIPGHHQRRSIGDFFVEGRKFQGLALLAGVSLVVLAYMLSPLLGGPFWANGERMDQQVQFLPFMLFAWFLLPFTIHLPEKIQKMARGLSMLFAASFVLVSLVCGTQIIRSHLIYRGSYLSDADVPLIDKMRAVDFIAHDWRSISTETRVPVRYNLGGERWYWVNQYGKEIEPWYTGVFTIGRGLDFELFRVYGLQNDQEGIQMRGLDGGRYVVSYAFQKPPSLPGSNMNEHLFGRLRVTVVQDRIKQ